jgi:hypothetical protein
MVRADEHSLGNIKMEEFEQSPVRVELHFTVHNEGRSSAMLTAIPPSLVHDRLSQTPDWTAPTKDVVVRGQTTKKLVLRIEGPGQVCRSPAATDRGSARCMGPPAGVDVGSVMLAVEGVFGQAVRVGFWRLR